MGVAGFIVPNQELMLFEINLLDYFAGSGPASFWFGHSWTKSNVSVTKPSIATTTTSTRAPNSSIASNISEYSSIFLHKLGCLLYGCDLIAGSRANSLQFEPSRTKPNVAATKASVTVSNAKSTTPTGINSTIVIHISHNGIKLRFFPRATYVGGMICNPNPVSMQMLN